MKVKFWLFVFCSIALLFFVFDNLSFSEGIHPDFELKELNPKHFNVSQIERKHGEATILIRLAKKISNISSAPHACRAWLEVTVHGKRTFTRYFDDIEPVGFSYGLFVLDMHLGPYLPIVKSGDYDGRLYLISGDGSALDVPGGDILVSPDSRYLFSQWASDSSAVTVIDLKRGRVVYMSDKLPYIQDWYHTDGQVFFTESEWLGDSTGPTRKPGVTYWYDFKRHKFRARNVDVENIKSATPLPFVFDLSLQADCSAVPAQPSGRALTNEESRLPLTSSGKK